MNDKVFIAVDDGEDDVTVNELVRSDVVETWTACANGVEIMELPDAELAKYEAKWGFPMIVGDDEQAREWLNQLEQNGKVSDTEENTCWAIAGTEAEARALLDEEVAKYE